MTAIEEKTLKQQMVSKDKMFSLTDKGIYQMKWQYQKKNRKGEIIQEPGWVDPKLIFSGTYVPLEKLIVDETVLFKVRTTSERVLTMKGIIDTMKIEGGIVNRNNLDDAVNAVSLDLPEKKGHATKGVYLKDGRLELCFDIMPFKDMQMKMDKRCIIDKEITKDKIEPYIKSIKHWHPYEIYPAMGMSVMAPFALFLRSKGRLVPMIWHYALKSHLGKSTVQQIFSEYLFSIFPVAGNTISGRSGFRFLSVVDSICGYITVNEVDNVDWKALDDDLKNYPENKHAGGRGQGNLQMVEYWSRAVLGLTSNRFKIKSKNTLTRIFKIEFDVTKEGERNLRENTDEIDRLLSNMHPIGWQMVENELEYVDHNPDKLIETIQGHINKIREYTTFIDPRRAFSWSIAYEGLKMWEREASLEWIAPSYEEFANDVINPIEKATKNTGVTPVADFTHWWEMWKAKNNKKMIIVDKDNNKVSMDDITGLGDIWDQKTIFVNGKERNGDVITGAILREYEKDREHQIDSLADIGKSIMSITGIPLEKLYGGFDIGGNTKWAVFIPDNLLKYKVEDDKS